MFAVVLALAGTIAQAQAPDLAIPDLAIPDLAIPDLAIEVTPEAGRALARQALQSGNPDLAARIAAQLVAANPKDVVALLLLTAGLSRSGHAEAAVAAGRKSYWLADTRVLRFEAAYLTAEALSVADRPGQAKLWLRRADPQAAGDAERLVLREAFRDLDARTPLKFSMALGGGPTDNVNGGSLHDFFYFEGFPPIEIAEALPGWTLTQSATLSYRLLRESYRTGTLYATAQHRNVWLNDRARMLEPDAVNADYLYNAVDLGGSVDWLSTDRLLMRLDGRAGRRWLGGAVQSDQQRLTFGVTRPLNPGRAARLELTAETTQIPLTPRANSLRLAAEASLSVQRPAGNLQYSLGLTQLEAAAPGVAYRAISVGVDWQRQQLFKGIDLGLFADLGAKDFWKTADRPDLSLAVGITGQFSKVSLWGFRPSVTLSATRAKSAVVVRDIASLSLTLGWTSSF